MSMILFLGSPDNNAGDLMEISNYLGSMWNTDIVFVVDANKNTSHHLRRFKVLAEKSKPCVKRLQRSNNDIALITFGNTSIVEFGFGSCKTEGCLMNSSSNIKYGYQKSF